MEAQTPQLSRDLDPRQVIIRANTILTKNSLYIKITLTIQLCKLRKTMKMKKNSILRRKMMIWLNSLAKMTMKAIPRQISSLRNSKCDAFVIYSTN